MVYLLCSHLNLHVLQSLAALFPSLDGCSNLLIRLFHDILDGQLPVRLLILQAECKGTARPL